jgi:hypothetical protein
MKLSRTATYAIHAATYIARVGNGRPIIGHADAVAVGPFSPSRLARRNPNPSRLLRAVRRVTLALMPVTTAPVAEPPRRHPVRAGRCSEGWRLHRRRFLEPASQSGGAAPSPRQELPSVRPRTTSIYGPYSGRARDQAIRRLGKWSFCRPGGDPVSPSGSIGRGSTTSHDSCESGRFACGYAGPWLPIPLVQQSSDERRKPPPVLLPRSHLRTRNAKV